MCAAAAGAGEFFNVPQIVIFHAVMITCRQINVDFLFFIHCTRGREEYYGLFTFILLSEFFFH